MKFLWSTSFRSFGKSLNNDNIQRIFLNSIKSLNIDVALFVTQFGEDNVEDEIKKLDIKYFCKDAKNKIPTNKKYSNKYMLKYSLEEFLKGDYDYYVHSTADLIIPSNINSSLLNFNKKNLLFFIFPNNLVVNGKLLNPTMPLFGIDIFIYKIDKIKAQLFLDLVNDWNQYDWGVVDNFLIAVADKMKLDFINIYKNSNLIKFENDFSALEEDDKWQKDSWFENNKYFLDFLKKNKLSTFYARGSYYYLALKFFRIRDLNFNLIICYTKLLVNLLINFFKKIVSKKNY